VAALRIAAELGLSPEVCAVIGDSASDVETGRAAGMHAVAVTWGFRTRAELVAAQPELVFDDPAELASLA
jgi:phosphoglycolate phosphatase